MQKIPDDDLDDGYNVVRSVKETISLYKNNRNTLTLYKNNCNKDRHLYSGLKEKEIVLKFFRINPEGGCCYCWSLTACLPLVFLVMLILSGQIW